jgi:hypothetical protein
MEDVQRITFRLESYLLQLADINRRWTAWLSKNEQAIILQDAQLLETLAPSAAGLLEDLNQAMSDRQNLLNDAREAGWNCASLRELARQLPAWRKSTLRTAVAAAQQQLSNLRRLHVATWVLISQAFNLVDGTLRLMMVGHAQQHVYLSGNTTETSGGRLLDTNL